MIRHIEGFDLSSFAASGLPYDINAGIFAQGDMITGQSQGHSWWFFNSAGGEGDYTKTLDAQSKWIFNIWFRPQITATGTQTQSWVDATWFRAFDAIGVLFYLHQTVTGHTILRGSADEDLLDLGSFPVGTWAAIQIKLESTGYTVRVNGVLIGTGAVGVWRPPDRFTFRWKGTAGINLDNLVVCDGQGTANADFLPFPWAVASRYVLVPTTSGWTPVGFPDAVTCVYDHQGVPTPGEYPDGDTGYIKPTGAGQRALFEPLDFVCQGRILGLALTVVAKPLSGGQTLKLIVEEQAGLHTIDIPSLTTRAVELPGLPQLDDYRAYLGIAETDPETGTDWTDGDISRYSWGVESVSTDVRVTQIFLQKVITTANLPYFCGGAGNYGF